jgi:hypothetical protein
VIIKAELLTKVKGCVLSSNSCSFSLLSLVYRSSAGNLCIAESYSIEKTENNGQEVESGYLGDGGSLKEQLLSNSILII